MADAPNSQQPVEEKQVKEEEEEVKHEVKGEKPLDPSLSPPRRRSSSNPFAFWAYLTLLLSLLALFLPSLRSPHPHSAFLSLPAALRRHYSDGRLIKAHSTRSPLHAFAAHRAPPDHAAAAETVLLLHGLASSSYSFRRVLPSLASAGFRAVALDLPGSGFSDSLDSADTRGGFLASLWDVYGEIREKGLFWAFDQLVETGGIPYEEIQSKATSKRGTGGESSGYGPAEMGRVVRQVVDAMELAPFHLVLHDSALGVMANWVSANSHSVQSLTLIDSSTKSAAFPSWILGVPVLGGVVLKSRLLFLGLLKLCCSRAIGGQAAEDYRLLLKGEDRSSAVVAAGRALNHSFDFGEWAGEQELKGVPVQVLWSGIWSDLWIDEGRRVAAALPQAKFSYHSGGRWPQEDAAEEIAGMIARFVSSLPKSVRHAKEEHLPDHIQRMFDEAKHHNYGHDHAHHNHGHGHGHDYAAGFMNMYGLDQGWQT